MFTTMLFYQTITNVYRQTSLIDEKKRKRYNDAITVQRHRARKGLKPLSNFKYKKGDSQEDDSEDNDER